MNTLGWIILIGVILGGGFLYGQSKIEKTETGFVFTKEPKVQTFYTGRIIWGELYFDHEFKTPVHNTEVVAFGDDWEFSSTTDDDGIFKVEVKGNVPFKIKASDGSIWATSPELEAVPTGTTFVDIK